MRHLVLVFVLITSLTLLTVAQDPVKADTKKPEASLVLTAEELNGLAKISQEAQGVNTKLQSASKALAEAEEEDSIMAAAFRWKIAFKGQQKLEANFSAWLKKAQDAHACENCSISQDGKSLVKPVPKADK